VVVGEGPFDLVLVGGWVVSNLDVAWEGPAAGFFTLVCDYTKWPEVKARFARVTARTRRASLGEWRLVVVASRVGITCRVAGILRERRDSNPRPPA
jgi:hypothetical protein